MRILKFKIDNFGIFKNFNWDENLPEPNHLNKLYDFKTINILYGRNYSGKTTLSKIINSLKTKSTPPKYENPNFEIFLENGRVIKNTELDKFNHPIHVYNTDFVEQNLNFLRDESQDIKPFSVVAGNDNHIILEKIEKLNNELGSNEKNEETGINKLISSNENILQNNKEKYEKAKKSLNELLVLEANEKDKGIKYDSKYGMPQYNKNHLEKDIATVQKESYKPLTEEDKNKYEQLIKEESKNTPSEMQFDFNFSGCIKSTKSILETVVGESSKIEDLMKNGNLNTWVQQGLSLHEHRDKCAFCDNSITDTRKDKLRQHFDEETQKLQDRINIGIQYLDKQLQSENLKISIDSGLYYEKYEKELSKLQDNLTALLDQQKQSIEKLKDFLEQKKGKLFTPLPVEYPENFVEKIKAVLYEVNAIRIKCSEYSNTLKQEQKQAKNTLRLNRVFDFIKIHQYEAKKKNVDDLEKEANNPDLKNKIIQLSERKEQLENAIKEEEKKLKDETAACNQINEILQHEFGHNALNLQAKENQDKNIIFEVYRDNFKAYNLSEGERSLIAFCYFLIKVKDDLNNDKKPIIWIDDPISSLDSNHIFFIFSLIEEYICKDKKYDQLFISTHNLEFLKYLRRITGALNDTQLNSENKKKHKCGYYLIQRIDKQSIIKQMPLYLSKYITEFNFLFEQIYNCAIAKETNDSNYQTFYNFGNNARKFLEIYTFFKFPSGLSSEDEKLQKFWGEDIITKILANRVVNENSHLTGYLEKGISLPETGEMQKLAEAIINKVQCDREQYKALLESVGIEEQDDPLNSIN